MQLRYLDLYYILNFIFYRINSLSDHHGKAKIIKFITFSRLASYHYATTHHIEQFNRLTFIQTIFSKYSLDIVAAHEQLMESPNFK